MSAGRPVPFATVARDLLRTTLLDAVAAELREKPWAAVKMADVARAAGVSRQTVYNEFGSRHDLAQAFALREVDGFLATVEEAVEGHREDPAAALAAAFETFLGAAAENPFVRSIVSGEGSDDLLPLVTTQGEPVLARATERLGEFLGDGWPQMDAAQARLLAETTVRLAISYAALPQSPAGIDGRAIAALLGPYVDRAIGRAPA
ncbi:MAG TPA: TetR family transcriptional regulator [Solirubrobacteraceae bacterium]|jgi:AcrR family transcriptional regulator